jgi:hypothetical protein
MFLEKVLFLGLVIVMGGCKTAPDTSKPPTPAPAAPSVSQSPAKESQMPEQSAFYGAWERASNGNKLMFYFVGDTYALYYNGKLDDDGVFTLDGNKLYLWPYDTSFYLYTFAISPEGITLKKDDAPAMSGLWTKSPYYESTGDNAVVGSWKNESGDTINFLRFYSGGGGSWFHCNAKTMEVEKYETLQYDLPVNGEFTQEIDMGLDGWGSSFFLKKHQYTLENNRLVLTEGGSVYIKQ